MNDKDKWKWWQISDPTGSKTIFPDAMEARVRFQKDTIKQFGDTIMQYQAWHQYVIEKHQVEVAKLVFPQALES